MNIFQKIKRNLLEPQPPTAIINGLLSRDSQFFDAAMSAVVNFTNSGDARGIIALEKAICLMAGRSNFEFYHPSKMTGDEQLVFQLSNPPKLILEWAQKRVLMVNPDMSMRMISAFVATQPQHKISVNELAEKINEIGGKKEYCAFRLLFNYCQQWAVLDNKKSR